MKNKPLYWIPSTLETWGVVFASLLLLLIGNAKSLLQRYGLIQSSQIVKAQLSSGVGNGLSKLDSFTFTRSVVSFAIWGMVGLVAFSLVQALLRASGQLKYQRELSSNNYVHAATFNRRAFWKQAILHGLLSFVLLAVLVTYTIIYTIVLVPISFHHARRFLLQVSTVHLPDLLAGLLLLIAATYVLYTLARLSFRHHQTNVI